MRGVSVFLLFVAAGFLSPLPSQQLNREMRYTLEESDKINPEPDKAYVHVRSEVPNLRFDSNRRIEKVDAISSGNWALWLPYGTHKLKITADGFQLLELPAMTFGQKKSYELVISAGAGRADEELIEITFDVNEDSTYISLGNNSPILSRGKSVDYKLAKGQHNFRFEKPGFVEQKRTMTVTQPERIPIRLVPGGVGLSSAIKLPGFLVLSSVPAGVEVVLDGQVLGTTPLQIDVTAGIHQLELRKPLYYPDVAEIRIEEAKTVSLSRTLKPRFGYLNVSADMTNTNVTLDGKVVGQGSIIRREIESGVHEIKVETPLHHPYTERFEIRDGDVKSINAILKPAYGTLEVLSLPEDGANVFLDGTLVGRTPYKNERLASGRYILRVSKELFGDTEQEITIADQQILRRPINLSKNFGTLKVTAANSRIYIDDKPMASNSYLARLSPGRYRVKAVRDGPFKPVEREVTIGIGEEREVTIDPEGRLGALSVKVEPFAAADAKIYLNNELKGNAPLALRLLMGDYALTARKEGYLDTRRNVTITEGETKTLTLELLTYEGSRLQVKDTWGTVKWISGAAAVAAGGAAVYFNAVANKNYDKYNSATSSADATMYRDKVTQNDKLTKVAIGVAAGCAATALVSWIVQASY